MPSSRVVKARNNDRLLLKLFIAGRTIRSENAVSQARRISEVELNGRCDLVIIDVLEEPAVAEQERILATPSLVKEFPAPARRVIGDLGDIDKVMAGLGLHRSRLGK